MITEETEVLERYDDIVAQDLSDDAGTQKEDHPTQDAESAQEQQPTDAAPKESPVSKRIAELTYRYRQEQREKEALLAELERVKTQTVTLPTRPKEDDFEDASEYEMAMDKYYVELAKNEYRKEHSTREAEEMALREEAEKEALSAEFIERADKSNIRSLHKDFDEVVSRPLFTEEMAREIYSSEHGPEVAYYIGTNESIARRLMDMDHVSVVREIARLEGKVAAMKMGSISTKAPPPLTPVSGSQVFPDDDYPEDMDEYARKRNKEEENRWR